MFQVAILAIYTSFDNNYLKGHIFTFGPTWISSCYLAIFVFYTMELVFKFAAFVFGWHNGNAEPRQFLPESSTPRPTPNTCAKCHSSLSLNRVFNILDLVAVISYWVYFIMGVARVRESRYVQIFAMLSALRILRLLRITAGTDSETTVIFEAVKESSAKLGKVALFICFFWLLFAVIGVQIFKSSLRRTCFLAGTNSSDTRTTFGKRLQFCGGYIANGTGVYAEPWLKIDGSPGAVRHKGYLCPRGSVCQESINPYGNSVSFDNIFQSLELVFVIFSANTFSTLMYYVVDSDGLASALFFAVVIIVLYFWLVILLVGVITGSMRDVRKKIQATVSRNEGKFEGTVPKPKKKSTQSTWFPLQKAFQYTRWLWIGLIAYDLIVQAQGTAQMSIPRKRFIDLSETIVTFLLLLEIIVRLSLDWRNFHTSKQNLADLTISIITSMMQLEIFKRAGRVYVWFTVFQIVRIYRVLWAIRPIRDLMMLSFSYFPAMLQLSSFLFLLVFLASILATQMFITPLIQNKVTLDDVPFSDAWKSFLGMYQIFTGEDWTKHLYAVTELDYGQRAAWISAIFVIGWFIISSIIILNMFLSRIDDSLNLPDDQKRFFQIRNFLRRKSGAFTDSSTPGYTQVPGGGIPASHDSTGLTDAHLNTVIKEFLRDDELLKQLQVSLAGSIDTRRKSQLKGWCYQAATKTRILWPSFLSVKSSQLIPVSVRDGQRRCSAWYTGIFGKIQQCCRMLLDQQTADGYPRSQSRLTVGTIFKIFIYTTIISQIIITCVTTPLYQRLYWMQHEFSVRNWFVMTDFGFAIVWSVEAIIKIVAGGLIMGPDAYLRGWNLVDATVLVTSWAGVALRLYNVGHQVAGLIVSFKAFRVLRLLTMNKRVMREITFIFRRGSYRIFAAILVSLSLLTPFAIFGLNLFMGQSSFCNDGSVLSLHDCVAEFPAPGLSGRMVLAPRVVSRPYYSFDNFGQSFYTLFLIVSQEGWTDVMYWARGSNDSYMRAGSSTSNMNALFFVIFNFCGTIFVTALFASLMIQNYTEATGAAYLTRNQRAWIEQRRLLQRVRPARRPPNPETLGPWRRWCYGAATRKEGNWQRFIVAILLLHLVFLCVNFYPSNAIWEVVRDIVSIVIMLILLLNMVIRIVGLSLAQFFKRPWDIFGLVLIIQALGTSILQMFYRNNAAITYSKQILQDSVCLLLIPYVASFEELFNVAVASIPLISTLLVTWFVLLLFFAIGLTQAFALTRFGPNETGSVNFRTIPKALILLFRMTLGEGQTKIMEDFAAIVPPYCTAGERFFESDCGNPVLARFLFIAWKVLSMYLFTNLFISLVYESFSYVYQPFAMTTGTLSRTELRHFKDAWARVDPKGTGYIPPSSLAQLTSRISGALSTRIYDAEFSIPSLLRDCTYRLPLHPGDINLALLNTRLQHLPIPEIQSRRRTLNRLHMELLRTSDPQHGISFTTALTTLITHKILDNREYLQFQDYLDRESSLRDTDDALRIQAAAALVRMHLRARALRRQRRDEIVIR